MCLAIPSLITSISGSDAEISVGGIKRKISIFLTPQAKPGDYVLVHAGYAINIIDQKEAEETLKLFDQMASSMDTRDE